MDYPDLSYVIELGDNQTGIALTIAEIGFTDPQQAYDTALRVRGFTLQDLAYYTFVHNLTVDSAPDLMELIDALEHNRATPTVTGATLCIYDHEHGSLQSIDLY